MRRTKVLGQPPNMSMTTVANPSIPGPPRQPHTINDAPNQTMAINPYPLTPAPPYGRRSGGLLGRACAGAKNRVRLEQPSRTGRGDLSFARIRSVRPSGRGRYYQAAQHSGASLRELSLVTIGAVFNAVHRTAASRQPSSAAGEHFCGKRDQARPARLCGARTRSSSAPGSRPGPRAPRIAMTLFASLCH